MENKNILMLRHHPMNVYYTNSFYTNQTENDLSEYIIIDVTSRVERDKVFMEKHPNFNKEISPFFIGPLTSSDGIQANIFELFWQCGKVYPCHDDHGKPNNEYFKWRNYYYKQKECTKDIMRHTCKSIGYEHKDTLYFAYFDKELNDYVALDYVQARKKVYFPEYAKLVYHSEAFKYLKSLVDAGKKIALVDFDTYNYNEEIALKKKYEEYLNKCKKNKVEHKIPLSAFLKVNNLKEVINCPFMLAGHGFVLKALLQADIEVVGDKVIDHSGILE